MADNSLIEWTDATWNPIVGCKVLSAGCAHCYAMTLAGGRMKNHPTRAGLTTMTSAGPVWNGQVRFNFEELVKPLTWKRPRKIFVCSHADLFYEGVSQLMVDRVWAVMAMAGQHTFQVLTKRPARMRAYVEALPGRAEELGAIAEAMATTWGYAYREDGIGRTVITALSGGQPLPNVWLGTSTEDQAALAQRVPELMNTPARMRFVSAEPALGRMDLREIDLGFGPFVDALDLREPHGLGRIDWVIVGGESGPKARPMHPDWARKIRDDCTAAGVAFHFKQWGEWIEADFGEGPAIREVDADSDEAAAMAKACDKPAWISLGGDVYRAAADIPDNTPARMIERVGKKAAGRILDGRTHDGMPR